MARMDWSKTQRNPLGYEQAEPRAERSREQWRETRRLIRGALPYAVKPAPAQLRPFLGLDDPRVTYYAELSYGKVVSQRGRL